MFAPCLYYVLMSFDVKIGKINHRGTKTKRRSQKSDFRFEKQRADQSGRELEGSANLSGGRGLGGERELIGAGGRGRKRR